MILRIRYKIYPDFPGFEYHPSEQAQARGGDALQAELQQIIAHHTHNWPQFEEVVDGKKKVRKLTRADLVAHLFSDEGDELEEVAIK